MCAESWKIHLIVELLKTDNDAILTEIETVFKNAKTPSPKKPSIYDFLGVISSEDAAKMEKAIHEI